MDVQEQQSDERAQLEAAVAGDKAAQAWMVRRLNPVVHKSAARLLYSIQPMLRGRPSRQEVVDLTQEAWGVLLDKRGRALLDWDPAKGPLDPYVSRVVKNRLVSKLRTLKHNPFTDDPTADETLTRLVGLAEQISARVEDADLCAKVLADLWQRLTPLGQEVLQVFLMDGATVDDVMAETGLTKESVRSWRKRIRNEARAALADLTQPTGGLS